MRGIISLLKTLYYNNKLIFVIALIAVLVLIVGCSSQGYNSPPPSGPVGGGC